MINETFYNRLELRPCGIHWMKTVLLFINEEMLMTCDEMWTVQYSGQKSGIGK